MNKIKFILILISLAFSSNVFASSKNISEHDLFLLMKNRTMSADISSMRNPFIFSSAVSSNPVVANTERLIHDGHVAGPLESYSLESLIYTGYYKIGNQVVANVRTPDNEGVMVKVGEYMGRNSGKITKITELNVELVEQYATRKGTIKVVTKHVPISSLSYSKSDIIK